jgi:hypothetical protein
MIAMETPYVFFEVSDLTQLPTPWHIVFTFMLPFSGQASNAREPSNKMTLLLLPEIVFLST